MNLADFEVDAKKCIGCGMCVRVCPGGVLYVNDNRKAAIRDFDRFGWNGCWRCEHCLAVCPKGAISIFGKSPENSLEPVKPEDAAPVLDALITNRHSCRRFKDANVEPGIVSDMLSILANVPNGGNKQLVEYTLIDDKERMNRFRRLAYTRMEELAQQGIYAAGFDGPSYDDLKGWEATVRPDMLFCSAPHILIPHAPLGAGEPEQDVMVAGTYFEILCASRGLGCVMMTYPRNVLELMPDIKDMLEIPEDHFIGMIIGFGWPEIRYARGTQRATEPGRIHRPKLGSLLADYHVHTAYSDDSRYLMEDVVKDAIRMGLDEICFTDHVDYGIKHDRDEEGDIPQRQGGIGEPDIMPLANVDYPRYAMEIDRLRRQYGGQITIRMGLEFGMQQHTISRYEKLFARYPFDFIILSVHEIDDLELWTQDYQQGRTQEEYNKGYYEEIYALVRKYKNYSVLGHLDLISRYDLQGHYPFESVKPVIEKILRQVIADGKGIEVNTSGVRYGIDDYTPSADILRLYRSLGGKIITIGSDSHKPEHLGTRIAETMSGLKELGFTEFCTYNKMIPEFHPL